MTKVIFRSPEYAPGECILGGYIYPRDTSVTECPAVFRSPEYAPGMCIFSDGQVLVPEFGGGGDPRNLIRAREEDEELLAVIMAAATIH